MKVTIEIEYPDKSDVCFTLERIAKEIESGCVTGGDWADDKAGYTYQVSES